MRSAAFFLLTSNNGFANANMVTTGATTQPIGHYEFCKASPTECKAISPNVAPHVLTRENWAAIVDINNAVNTRVAPLTDDQIWGKVEVWSYPTTVGDCEDYVLQKRKELMQEGFAASNLLITVVKQPNGDGHAVLTVRTDRGDFILDNLVGRINEWRDTPYKYLKRQSTGHAGRWVTIEDNRRQLASN
ncbi:MAG: transglutaminase-like cysteine peptidase [Ahrensia sp.]|nr:transglutaminase-like cysteine peptidase [Ahrensia sp.]